MTIGNKIGVVGYSRYSTPKIAGTPHGNVVADPLANPLKAQAGTLTVGGTAADGDYTATFTDEFGDSFAVTFARASGENNDAITAAWSALVPTTDEAFNVFRSSAASSVATLTFLHPDRTYTVSTSAPGGATFTWAQAQAPGGVTIPFGRFLALGSNGEAALPAAATADQIVGLSLRTHGTVANLEQTGASAVDGYVAPAMVPAAFEGDVDVTLVGSTAAANHGVVHVVINVAGGDNLGEVRAAQDGANTVALPITRAYFTEATNAPGVTVVRLKL